MKLITVQHENVLATLNCGNTYTADISRVSDNLIEPYKRMMSKYNYTSAPVFCGVVGRKTEFYGAKLEDTIILEIEVPDDLVNLQVYYDWSDVIFFMEIPEEWNGTISLEQFIRDTLNGVNTNDDKYAIQATIPYIKPEWLLNSYKISDTFQTLHYGSGGANILKETSYQ